MRITGKVKVNVGKLTYVRVNTLPGSKAMRGWLGRSAVTYRTFWQQRYARFAKGGGNWKQTKKFKAKKSKYILIDTRTMIRALQPTFRNAPGQLEKYQGNSVTIGYGGPAIHPKADPLTVAQLASIHNTGSAIMPQRKIIVRPPDPILAKITDDLQDTISGVGRDA